MRKATFGSRTGGVKTMQCKECKAEVHNVDEKTVAVTCWKCVAKSLNPHSVIISDMSKEELSGFLKKQRQNGRSEN
jgi:NAD-dependent SIR2 family protein deacetylase